MQIHELNNFTGTLGSGAYLAIDDGNDTGKISSQGLLAATEARIDNIIAGPAPSAEEIVDARLGADGVTYPSLGDAIRDQFTDLKSGFNGIYNDIQNETTLGIENFEVGSIASSDGRDASNASRLRTTIFVDSAWFPYVHAQNNYQFVPFAYDKNGDYIGVWTTNNAFEKTSAVQWESMFRLADYPDYQFRFAIKNSLSPTENIDVSESANVLFSNDIFVNSIKASKVIRNVSWISNQGIRYDNGYVYNSTKVKTSGFIPIESFVRTIHIKLPIYASNTTFGLCFFDEQRKYISGVSLGIGSDYSYEYRNIDVPQSAVYFRTIWFNDEETYGTWDGQTISNCFTKPYYSVCASDSSEADQSTADFVCSGTNDEEIIARVLRIATYQEVNEVRFAKGTYHIDSFPHVDGGGIHLAIPLGYYSSGAKETIINLKGDGYGTFRKKGTANKLYSGAQFVVSQSCYDALDSNTQYAIFGAVTNAGNRVYPSVKCCIEHIGIVLPDNQKSVICIDGWNMSALSFDDIHLMAIASDGDAETGAITPSDLHMPVDGCIGVRGLQGSCYGINNMWRNAFAWGFETGFQVVGEHIVAMDLGARFCKYGYKFGSLSRTYAGNFAHPNTLINCCDELNFNLPLFAYNSHYANNLGRQALTIIDYNLEWQPEYAALGGALATELEWGEWYGKLDFSNVAIYASGKNAVNVQFWATNCGHNIVTRNTAHSESGTTAERTSYTPQYMQKYYDTTLNKMLIYNGSAWVDMNGNAIS